MSEPAEITDTLNAIERASAPLRELAREAVRRHRGPRLTPTLTQAMIDSGGDEEERRQRFVASAVRFGRRGLLSWLLRR